MRRVTLDLILVVLMAMGLLFLYDYANGRVTEGLTISVALTDSLMLSLYVVFAVLPRYIARIRDSDVRSWINTAKLSILVFVVWILSTGGDVFNMNPDKTTGMMCVDIGLIVYATIRLVYSKYMIKRNARSLENSKGGSE